MPVHFANSVKSKPDRSFRPIRFGIDARQLHSQPKIRLLSSQLYEFSVAFLLIFPELSLAKQAKGKILYASLFIAVVV